MTIVFKDTQTIAPAQLKALYLSVDWDSGNHPDRLAKAIKGSDSVFSAWDGDKLVGLVNVLSDGSIAAYVHYLLVRPEYQGEGIGRALIERVTEAYADCLHVVLVSYNEQIRFYEQCGFECPTSASPMFKTSLRI